MLLGEILMRKSLITDQQLNSILTEQEQKQKKLGELLLDIGLISNEDLEKSLREQYWRKNGYWVIEMLD